VAAGTDALGEQVASGKIDPVQVLFSGGLGAASAAHVRTSRPPASANGSANDLALNEYRT
jgi:hypothetical protein